LGERERLERSEGGEKKVEVLVVTGSPQAGHLVKERKKGLKKKKEAGKAMTSSEEGGKGIDCLTKRLYGLS